MIMNMMKCHQMRKLQTKIQHQRFSEFCCLFITCNFYDGIKFVLYFALFSIKISDLPPTLTLAISNGFSFQMLFKPIERIYCSNTFDLS